jgi:antitoxin VapB
MGVQLNIKDPETVRLARELAGRTGKSVTETIRAALEREVREAELAARQRRSKFEEMIAGSRSLWKPDLLARDHDDLLYDEEGLPR